VLRRIGNGHSDRAEPQMTTCGRGSTGSTKMCPSQGTMERAVFWLPASAAKSKCPASALTGTRPALVLKPLARISN
jgi:hypothetical protein